MVQSLEKNHWKSGVHKAVDTSLETYKEDEARRAAREAKFKAQA